MQVAVPAPEGVRRPVEEMVPPVAVHVTAELYDPVPDTVAEHCDVCPVVMDAGEAATAMEVMVAGTLVTVMGAEPVTFVYPDCVDVATQLPVPVPDGVNTPAGVIVPPVAVHVTAVLYDPVPVTAAEHCDV